MNVPLAPDKQAWSDAVTKPLQDAEDGLVDSFFFLHPFPTVHDVEDGNGRRYELKNSTRDIEGGCSCGFLRYKLVSDPLIVHCCHCRYCQNQTGTVFALNALYDASKVEILSGTVNKISVPTPSGHEQLISRCPKCEVAVWSNYLIMGVKELVHFVRVGTLDNPDLLPPDVHIYTKSKQPWVVLPPGDLAVEEFYDYKTTWAEENLKILDSLLTRARAAE